MLIKKSSYRWVKRFFVVFLMLIVLGSFWNASLEEASTLVLLLTIIGWSGATTTGAMMATRKVVCPRCASIVIPAVAAQDSPCRYCPNT